MHDAQRFQLDLRKVIEITTYYQKRKIEKHNFYYITLQKLHHQKDDRIYKIYCLFQ